MNLSEKKEVDELDLRILQILSEDGRINKSSIAEKLRKSPNTIKKRIEDMETKKIIKTFGVQIDYEKIGYDIMALIELTISKGKMLEVEKEISNLPNIFGVYDITGTYDAVVLARFKTRSELSELVKQINSSEFVVRTNTHLILNVIKDGTSFKDLIESEK